MTLNVKLDAESATREAIQTDNGLQKAIEELIEDKRQIEKNIFSLKFFIPRKHLSELKFFAWSNYIKATTCNYALYNEAFLALINSGWTFIYECKYVNDKNEDGSFSETLVRLTTFTSPIEGTLNLILELDKER